MQEPSGAYTEYHPRWLRYPISTYWWLERRTYFLFILRELSSLFVAWAVAYLLLVVNAAGAGEAAFRELIAWSGRPAVLALNVATLAFLLLHAITWFNLAPQAMVVRLGRRRVPGVWIVASNYAAWAAISAGIALLLLRG